MILYMYIASAGQITHLGQNFNVNRKTSSLQPLILYTSFHDLINVYSPREGADNPQGTKFWFQQKHLVTSVICYKFQKNLFEVWFYTHFLMILYMYITPGGRQPLVDKTLISTERPYHFAHLLQVLKKKLFYVQF